MQRCRFAITSVLTASLTAASGPLAGLVLLPSSVAARSFATHQTAAEAAQAQLTPKAQAALQKNPNFVADGWGPIEIDEADQFNTDHPSNAQWQFVDLPLGAGAFWAADPQVGPPLRPFVGPNDIVHALQGCITILADRAGQLLKTPCHPLARAPGGGPPPHARDERYYNTAW